MFKSSSFEIYKLSKGAFKQVGSILRRFIAIGVSTYANGLSSLIVYSLASRGMQASDFAYFAFIWILSSFLLAITDLGFARRIIECAQINDNAIENNHLKHCINDRLGLFVLIYIFLVLAYSYASYGEINIDQLLIILSVLLFMIGNIFLVVSTHVHSVRNMSLLSIGRVVPSVVLGAGFFYGLIPIEIHKLIVLMATTSLVVWILIRGKMDLGSSVAVMQRISGVKSYLLDRKYMYFAIIAISEAFVRFYDSVLAFHFLSHEDFAAYNVAFRVYLYAIPVAVIIGLVFLT